jgi:hypothetical protein
VEFKLSGVRFVETNAPVFPQILDVGQHAPGMLSHGAWVRAFLNVTRPGGFLIERH